MKYKSCGYIDLSPTQLSNKLDESSFQQTKSFQNWLLLLQQHSRDIQSIDDFN